MKDLLLRVWPAAWPAAQVIGQLTDIDFLQRLDLLKGYLGALPHLLAFFGFCIFLIVFSLYSFSYSTAQARLDRLRKPLYWIVPLAFLVALNLIFVNLPDTAFWSEATPYRLSLTLISYVLVFWGLGILLASRNVGAALRG